MVTHRYDEIEACYWSDGWCERPHRTVQRYPASNAGNERVLSTTCWAATGCPSMSCIRLAVPGGWCPPWRRYAGQTMSPFLKYTLARLGLFVAVAAATLAVPLDVSVPLKLMIAVLVSAVLAFFLLRGLREEAS
ncbi:DUF4229 domain-containing protein, partial [Dactylosporangium sp. NPDC005572]|uniref:DUF4229 domain-containing protein n=1 Tax=Dactylosporangium sp. NPDC005572 TaxID=3156889 RepID=UPI0033AA4A94